MTQSKKVLYRFEISYGGCDSISTDIYIKEYEVIRETEKSYVIRYRDYNKNNWRDKFILKCDNIRKFAYDTKEEAKQHFARRLSKRIKWYDYYKTECETAQNILENFTF